MMTALIVGAIIGGVICFIGLLGACKKRYSMVMIYAVSMAINAVFALFKLDLIAICINAPITYLAFSFANSIKRPRSSNQNECQKYISE